MGEEGKEGERNSQMRGREKKGGQGWVVITPACLSGTE